MADVRALLAAEKQARRIQHPHLTYTHSGALLCNVCDLNVKSEQLWPGHLKSLNHRKNVQKTSEQAPISKAVKRKRAGDEVQDESSRDFEVDSRKKPKSSAESTPTLPLPPDERSPDPLNQGVAVVSNEPEPSRMSHSPAASDPAPLSVIKQPNDDQLEDELAAFERDIAPLAQPDYASATITAAPVSATELQVQQKQNPVQRREDEAEAEKEDETNRMMEEFEVMEEMEDRVKKLRARREALRGSNDQRQGSMVENVALPPLETPSALPPEIQPLEDSDNEDDEDDWYR